MEMLFVQAFQHGVEYLKSWEYDESDSMNTSLYGEKKINAPLCDRHLKRIESLFKM